MRTIFNKILCSFEVRQSSLKIFRDTMGFLPDLIGHQDIMSFVPTCPQILETKSPLYIFHKLHTEQNNTSDHQDFSCTPINPSIGNLPVASGILKGQIELVLRQEPVIAGHSVLEFYARLFARLTRILLGSKKAALSMHVPVDIHVHVF